MSNGMIPIGMNRVQLSAILHDMAERVEHGDSYDGNIEYHIPDTDDAASLPPGWPSPASDFWVQGMYRVGNIMGQGGMRMLGDLG